MTDEGGRSRAPALSGLFWPHRKGELELPNRIVMSAMTRSRAIDGDVPHLAAATYYAQRASAGLIISEGTQVSPQGVGYVRTPGIHSAMQVARWKRVTDAVHRNGGRIFLQLWHVGRVSHSDFHTDGLPVAPSAIRAEAGTVRTLRGREAPTMPRALELSEIAGVIDQFHRAAANAKESGFDGVEIHGANGYLLDQFLRDGSNQRGDAYGGSIRNRARFPLEVAEAVLQVWEGQRVAYKISPHFAGYSMSDSNPVETFSCLAKELNRLGVGYLDVTEPVAGPQSVSASAVRLMPILRREFSGALIANGGYEMASATAAIERGEADLIAFGTLFLANPDLPERLRKGAAMNEPDTATYYAGEEKGYTDYPTLLDQP